jgi:hypothetical protein
LPRSPPHCRYCVGDDAGYAKADYDDSSWKPLSPVGEVAGIRNAPVVWIPHGRKIELFMAGTPKPLQLGRIAAHRFKRHVIPRIERGS